MSGDVTLDPPDPEEYSAFISQIELRDLWLQSATVTNHHGPIQPDRATATFQRSVTKHLTADGFVAYQAYEVSFTSEGGEALAQVNVVFGVDYESQVSPSDGIFRIFNEFNLPLNTWPYLREFLSTSVGRMGWMPITIPALKSGVQSDPEESQERTEPEKKQEKKKPSKPAKRRTTKTSLD